MSGLFLAAALVMKLGGLQASIFMGKDDMDSTERFSAAVLRFRSLFLRY